jgi:hypothetical protein
MPSNEFHYADVIPRPTYRPSRPKPLLIFPSQVRSMGNIRNNGEVHNAASLLSYPLMNLRHFQPIEGPIPLTLLPFLPGTVVMQGHYTE